MTAAPFFYQVGGLEIERPDCFHCAIAPVINQFVAAHPQKPSAHLILEIAQTLGELVGSEVHRGAPRGPITEAVLREMNQSIEELLATMSRKKS